VDLPARGLRRLAALIVASLLCVPLTGAAMATTGTITPSTITGTAGAKAAAAPAFKALVFSRTTAFRHDSIPDGVAAIQKLGRHNNFTVDATEDDAFFTDANLARYDVVVFVSTTGDPLGTQAEKDAFQRYIENGGGFVGIHAAADSGYTWPWYGKLVGAYFRSHPAIQEATVKVEDPAHPSMRGLPERWRRTDEWYNYQSNPRGTVHVLASLDETSYDVGADGMGFDHPITWCQDYDGGRSWYTGLGHTKESYTEPEFLGSLLGGIKTAAGVVEADCSASLDGGFKKIALDEGTSNPMMLDVATDGRVFYIDRLGDVKVVKPGRGTVLAGHLDVFTANESGGLGIALDPHFRANHRVYVYYSPAGKDVDRLSRFTMDGNALDMDSEKIVLELPVQRAECCHHGGGMVIDHKTGDLWLATGDNTNPFASDGYTPIDERPERAAWDAQRSAGNTDSLSGKVLRIHPKANGSYTIPAGNLFPPGTARTRPEIYGMGFRNPFRIGIDPKTGKVMVANYGPDAVTASPSRGPENTVEWNILNKPGNYGWPYCIGDNKPYIDYDFATGESGAAFDCAAPVNDSPNNTGLTALPPAIPATVYYHYDGDPAFPELGGGGAPMAGPVYRYDPHLTSKRKWPAYWDGKAIFGEWGQNTLYSFQLSRDATRLLDINRIFPSMSFLRPMDLKFGPDGALYLIEWGSGFGGDNTDSGIYRIDYVQGNRAPVDKAAADDAKPTKRASGQ
jgi:cytochrome c